MYTTMYTLKNPYYYYVFYRVCIQCIQIPYIYHHHARIKKFYSLPYRVYVSMSIVYNIQKNPYGIRVFQRIHWFLNVYNVYNFWGILGVFGVFSPWRLLNLLL